MMNDSNDGWLRLNNNSDFASGTYTPSLFRADGGLMVNSSAWIRQAIGTLNYGTIMVGGNATGGYYGYGIYDGGRYPIFMSNNSSVGVYQSGGSAYWIWYDDGTNFNVTKNIVCSGTITGSSDVRLKKDITAISGALGKVKQLVGVTFTSIATDERNIGLVADDVEKVIPEAVKTGSNGFKALAYGNLAGVLVEAIKELEIEVAAIRAKVETLQ